MARGKASGSAGLECVAGWKVIEVKLSEDNDFPRSFNCAPGTPANSSFIINTDTPRKVRGRDAIMFRRGGSLTTFRVEFSRF